MNRTVRPIIRILCNCNLVISTPVAATELLYSIGNKKAPPLELVNLNGRIRHEAYGPVNWDADYIVRTFEQLMTEKPAASGNSMPAE